MGITDELRKYAEEQIKWLDMTKVHYRRLFAIADRIDAEHEKAMADSYLSGTPTDEKLTELGWVRLPVDADGEYIRIGDVVDVMPTDKFTGHKNVVVTSVIFKRSAELVTVDTADRPFTFMPNRIRHHHVPTVEDVLREFADEVQRCCDTADTIAEYAKRLTLAEEVDG